MTHYHVFSSSVGCLPDYDSGPLTLDDARIDLAQYISADNDGTDWVAVDVDMYHLVDTLYYVGIEPCSETWCTPDDATNADDNTGNDC